ncbi:MAG: 4Fe-4S dicluster domain-containing protein [Candidatus Eremiobacteraeota bacterium]|nr:4Fe-4S dicluster domain-containing protein [Candidatus Eremiobacteraeota bacterium]
MSTTLPTPPEADVRTFDDLLSDCVHCGFCLPACPTYRSWGEEMDSPRGRIDLMRGLHEGAIELTPTVVGHFDACLGCMGCLTSCPSGVQYDLLIEETRAKIEHEFPRSPLDRGFRELIFALFPRPDRLQKMAPFLYAFRKSGLHGLVRRSGVLGLLGKRFEQLDALLPPLHLRRMRAALPAFMPARRTRRGAVALVAGCVQKVFFPNVNASTARVLTAEGFDVLVPEAQGCCGALSLHAGRDGESKDYARELIDRFVPLADGPLPYDAIVINAAGCGSTLKQYGALFVNEPEYAARAERFASLVRDVSEFLAEVEPIAPRRPAPIRVAYHDACHLAQRIREQPRALLRSIPKLELVEIPQGDECCGSAGVYNLLEPESAREIGLRKAENVLSTGARLLASANPGCTLQIRSLLSERGIDLAAAHPIEILDAVIQ